MNRVRLDGSLSRKLAQQLTDREFLTRQLVVPLAQKHGPKVNRTVLQGQARKLEAKRTRILDTYFEGVIDGEERTRRLAEVDREMLTVNGLLSREAPTKTLSIETISKALAPFKNFDLLNREDKRRLLGAIGATIVAANYQIEGIWLGLNEGQLRNPQGYGFTNCHRVYLELGIAA